MNKFRVALATLLILSAMAAPGCVVHDGHYDHHPRWHYFRW